MSCRGRERGPVLALALLGISGSACGGTGSEGVGYDLPPLYLWSALTDPSDGAVRLVSGVPTELYLEPYNGEEVQVASIALETTAPEAFRLDLSPLASEQPPFRLGSGPWDNGEELRFTLTFDRAALRGADALATLRVLARPGRHELVYRVVGMPWGTDDPRCPRAQIACRDGDVVEPGTAIHCTSAGSHDLTGAPIVTVPGLGAHRWWLSRPAASTTSVVPADGVDTSFVADVAGAYVLHLTVIDSGGIASCHPAEIAVKAVASEGLHVRLTWRTPGDPDEYDEGQVCAPDPESVCIPRGSDLNLAAALVTPPGDTFPAFQDDTDGAGPEDVHLTAPAPGSYGLTVTYAASHGLGPAYATLAVYADGDLLQRWDDVELQGGDVWDAATLDWPSAVVHPTLAAGGGLQITPHPTP